MADNASETQTANTEPAIAAETAVAETGRRDEAVSTIRRLAAWSFGAGCIPLPVLDLATLLGLQVTMINKLSDIYDVPFNQHTAKNIAAALVGTVVPYGLTWGSLGTAIKSMPGVGSALGLLTMPTFSAAVTWALGRVYIQHLEAGGTLLDFDPDAMREHFRAEFEKAKAEQQTAQNDTASDSAKTTGKGAGTGSKGDGAGASAAT